MASPAQQMIITLRLSGICTNPDPCQSGIELNGPLPMLAHHFVSIEPQAILALY